MDYYATALSIGQLVGINTREEVILNSVIVMAGVVFLIATYEFAAWRRFRYY
jgi:hypothetical protein